MKEILRINGKVFSFLQLKEYVKNKSDNEKTPAWEKDIFEFIGEWVSDNDTVKVKTSGTTGEPRTYKISKESMRISARKTIEFFGLKPGDNALLCLSPRYIAGKLMVVRAFVGELNLITVEPTSVPLLNIETDIDFAAMVPMQVQKQMDEDTDAFEKLKTLIIGGGEVPRSLKEILQNISTEAWETYGMTETLTHVALKKINGKNRSDWFEALPGVRVGSTEDGRLTVDVAAITESKLVTNDMVEFDNKNRFKILGRADDVINTGGIKVIPQSVEKKIEGLIDHPFVVSSVPDDLLGEKLILVIEGDKFDFTALEKELNKLEFFERPKDFVLIPNMPQTETGKVKRKELKRYLQDL